MKTEVDHIGQVQQNEDSSQIKFSHVHHDSHEQHSQSTYHIGNVAKSVNTHVSYQQVPYSDDHIGQPDTLIPEYLYSTEGEFKVKHVTVKTESTPTCLCEDVELKNMVERHTVCTISLYV